MNIGTGIFKLLHKYPFISCFCYWVFVHMCVMLTNSPYSGIFVTFEVIEPMFMIAMGDYTPYSDITEISASMTMIHSTRLLRL